MDEISSYIKDHFDNMNETFLNGSPCNSPNSVYNTTLGAKPT